MAPVEPGWDEDELPSRARRNPLVAVVAVLMVLSLALSGVVIAVDRTSGDADDEREDATPTSVPTGPPPSKSELDDMVAEISDFVAEARGIEFTKPVTATLLEDAAFSERVRQDAIEDLAALGETEDVLRALGLLEDDVNLAETLRGFLGDGVVGFYDPSTGELVLRGATLTPYVRTTLAHELTHALDDQHFELDRPALDDADDESGVAFSSLVEGNAVRIEEEYRETLSDEERAQADAEEAKLSEGLDFASLPRVLPEIIGFPYAFGPVLVEALLDAGGEQRVNEAFAKPPLTTEHVLDPVAWLDGETRIDVAPPAAEGEVFDEGVLGLWGIVLLLEVEVGQQEAFVAAEGWGGDWYVAWRRGDEVCIRTTIEMDTERDLEQLDAALDEWALAQDDAQLERGDGQLTVLSCG